MYMCVSGPTSESNLPCILISVKVTKYKIYTFLQLKSFDIMSSSVLNFQ